MNDSTDKTRWPQFTLRAAIVLFLVVAAFLAGRVSIQSALRISQANETAARMRIRELSVDLENAEFRAELVKREAAIMKEGVNWLRDPLPGRNELLNAQTYQELREAYSRNGMSPPRTGIPIIHKELIQKAPEPDER